MFDLIEKMTLLGTLVSALFVSGSLVASDSPILDRVLDVKVLKVGMSGKGVPAAYLWQGHVLYWKAEVLMNIHLVKFSWPDWWV